MNLLKNLLHGVTTPLKKKPMRMLLWGGGIYILGVLLGLWPNFLVGMIR
tara:strand:- start:49 stop:195 length:147 start_codon:yes stop_codon:yes gene_type:complete